MTMSAHTEGDEYCMQAYAIEIEPGRTYGGVSLVRRLPGGEQVFLDVSSEYGCSYTSERLAVRHALVKGQGFIRAEQRRRRPML